MSYFPSASKKLSTVLISDRESHEKNMIMFNMITKCNMMSIINETSLNTVRH